MKTAGLKTSRAAGLLLALALTASGSWNVSFDGDGRYTLSQWRQHSAELHVLGASVRKTFADDHGDRLTLFGLLEAEHNFDEVMLHELYARYKGPLGAWNVTLGRFGLPYGLLYSFSTSRLLYRTPHDQTLGMDVDNGLMVSGTVGLLDYGLALTQGYGPHRLPEFPGHGLLTGRAGLTLGEAEEVALGLSVAAGTTEPHPGMHAGRIRRALGGLDATVYLGRSTMRAELSAGQVAAQFLAAGLFAWDFALLPKMDVTAAVTASRHGQLNADGWFVGATFKPRWLTIRGGYRYAYFSQPAHEFTLQLYRLFSFTF